MFVRLQPETIILSLPPSRDSEHMNDNCKPNSNQSECPIYNIMRLISAKWTVEIMRELSIQPTRTRQFLSRIPGLSMKCLQERLKELDAAGMLRRVKFDEKVPKVEHHITPRGEKLLAILLQVKQLAEESAPSDCQCPIEYYVKEVPLFESSCPKRRQ